MAARTGSSNPWQPLLGADPARLRLLGELLRRRRGIAPPAGLGYRHMPAFSEDRGINTRLAGDIERARRDTYTLPKLEDIARAYGVTDGSVVAVARGEADELVPAGADAPAAPAAVRPLPVPAGPPGWPPGQIAANRPWFDKINRQLLNLARKRIEDPSGTPPDSESWNPSGAQMFGEATDDAVAWDTDGAPLPLGDRMWFIADLQRQEAERAGNSGTGTAGA